LRTNGITTDWNWARGAVEITDRLLCKVYIQTNCLRRHNNVLKTTNTKQSQGSSVEQTKSFKIKYEKI